MATDETGLLLASKPKRAQGEKTGGKDRGQRQGTKKIGYYLLLISLIIAHQISIFTTSVKPDKNFLGLILFILSVVAFLSLIIEVLALAKLRVWCVLYF
jgi:hypothetical protein